MNEELKAKLLQYLSSVEGSVEKAIDFTSEQAPLYVKELCQIGVVENGTKFLCCVIGLCLVWTATAVINYLMRKQDAEARAISALASLAIAVIVSIPLSCFGLDRGIEAYKAAYAPRVFIVERIHEMTK